MARRLEPPVPGSEVGGRGGGVGSEPEPGRTVPTLDLTASAIIGIAPASGSSAPGRDARRAAELDDVRQAHSLSDVRLLNRVRDGLLDLNERAQARPASAGPASAGPVRPGPFRLADVDDDSLAAIRSTFAMVQAAGDDAAAYFYGWLFTAHPELRELFPPAMNEQRDRLFAALTTIVGSLRSPAEMTTYLAELGRDHRRFSVRPDMYEAMGDALVATLRAFAGPALTPAAEQTWLGIYQTAAETMIKAADAAGTSAPAFWTAQVIGHRRPAPGVAVVTVAPDRPLPYQAGQHVTVQTRRWPKVWRPYSLAGVPRADGLLTFHVKAIPGGWVSNALVQHTAVGDELILGPAAGRMLLAPAGSRDLVCVAGGTGLAPIRALAEQVVCGDAEAKTHRSVALFWGAASERELYDLDQLWQLSDAYPWLQVYPVTSDDEGYRGLRGSVGKAAARYLPHLDCEAYVAGPPRMVRETIELLGKAGLPAERIHYDESVLSFGRRAGSGT